MARMGFGAVWTFVNSGRMSNDEVGVPRLADSERGWSGFNFEALGNLSAWLSEHALTIFMVVVILATVIWVVRKIRQRRDQIQKLWVFILFFLTSHSNAL